MIATELSFGGSCTKFRVDTEFDVPEARFTLFLMVLRQNTAFAILKKTFVKKTKTFCWGKNRERHVL